MILSLPSFRFRKAKSGPARKASPLGQYTHPSFFQRHRRKLITLLIAFMVFYGMVFALTTTYFIVQLSIPIVVASAFVIWLLPESATPPLRLLSRMFALFIAALLLWPDYLAIALPGMPWITMVRLVGAPLAFVLLVCLSSSAPVREDFKTVLGATPSLWKLLTAFAAIAFLSIAYSTDPAFSANKFIVAGINWFLIYFVAAYVFRTPGRALLLAYSLWAIAIVVSLVGIQEWRHSAVPWAGHIPRLLAVEDDSVKRLLSGAARAATGKYRMQSKFTTSLGLAEYYALTIPFVIHFAATARLLWVRIAALLTIPFMFQMIVLTDSRLGMVGFFFAILFYLLAWGFWRWQRDRDSLFGPVTVLSYPALFSAFIAATFLVGRLRALVWGTGAQQASTDSRKLQVAMGIPKVLSHPWGYGLGRGAEALNFTNGAGVLTIDTYYLDIALEVGVIGFVVYYAFFISALLNGVRRMGRATSTEEMLIGPICIAIVNFLVIKSIFSQTENHPLVFALVGLLSALCWRIDIGTTSSLNAAKGTKRSVLPHFARVPASGDPRPA